MTNGSKTIVFVSTLNCAPWGGSELLWYEAALRLAKAGHKVAVSVCGWPNPPKQLETLRQAGIEVNERWSVRRWQSISGPVMRRVNRLRFSRWLADQHPDLVCTSSGSIADDLALVGQIAQMQAPFVLLLQAAAESLWPNDTNAQRLIGLYEKSRRWFFVSEGNRQLLETQLGIALPKAEVVRNPFSVRRDVSLPWPSQEDGIRLACVGRLDPDAKGQDLLMHVLASERWRSRPLTVSLFGKGDKKEGLSRLMRRLQIENKIKFAGHVDGIEALWATHHALILPSRFEGLPLATVEAMHCGRIPIVTDVAGNTEVVTDGVTGFVAEAATAQHLDAALERAWQRRGEWQRMGQEAAKCIRELVPADPAAVFADRLVELAK